MRDNLKYPYSPPDEGGSSSTNTTPEIKPVLLAMADEATLSPQPRIIKVHNAVRRSRSPPRNEHNQIFCDHINCQGKGQTFKRVCEWNKHMDRHERPYKCREPGCELNPGFTYSGGLLRHQREVHRMHLSTKQPLFCPFPNCNRSSGTGFTRKENLEEHKRRRHLEELSNRDSNRASSHPEIVTTTTATTTTASQQQKEEHHEKQHRHHLQQLPPPKRRRLSTTMAAGLAGSEPIPSSNSSRQQDTESRVARPSEGQELVSKESDVIQWLRGEVRNRDDVILRQANELQRLQALLQALPPQTVYNVQMQARMPPAGPGG